ncbi:nascent polypeptide-associated complex subunit alpha, muscle-specific form isoform X1 [Fundulus heteroclitus]|uniref:nascent polypeptide-associated complex subunit alpha, muscle-specific form isoform X1 n=2 Tax=Fundulus heteroclitus TaxID=8078 RepID=UPI00165B060F|nr:nascent polypeptide-associated complex subunit alpha, muscle-specific form isoform X1 [Fundulus heteroclitus]
MASLCKRQQCTIDRRGFRQELDSWRHKLLHCVGFESIVEGLIGPKLVEDLKVFKDVEPVAVSDWSFDENCQFCCLRRDKVKEHLLGFNKEHPEDAPKPLLVKDQIRIIRLEKKAEEFLNAILCRKDVPNFSDPHIPVVAREILQRMISQFAAEYTSKTSSPQASRSDSPPHSDQSRPAPLHHLGTPSVSPADSLSGPAQNQNPVLSQLLMAAQDAPLDLTIKKPAAEPHQQDGVLDLSIKKNRNSSSSISANSLCLSPAVSTLKCESPDYRAAKAKDLQSTSTLEQFMAKLCPQHQRRIVDAIGFLQTEVKAHASSNVQKTSDSTSGNWGKASPNANSSSINPEKSHPELKLRSESTPKAEVLEFPHSVPNSCVQNKIPENAVSLKTSADRALDAFSLGFGSDQALTSSSANSVDGENSRHSDQPPVRMKIKTSNAAAGKKLSCVLDATLSSPSSTPEKRSSSNTAESQRARLSSSVKRHSLMSVTSQAGQKEVLGHQKDKPAKVFPTHFSFPSDSVRTARKSVRGSSEIQIRDDACREIVDPDIGNCDIVFIDKPITECFKEKRRCVTPRRNARKSIRRHMYSDDIWELKTVRTLAGRGNCPNPMPEPTTPVTPKQMLSKPEGLPPVDMPFAGACTETMNQQMPTEESEERVIPGAGDDVEVAASKVDAIEVEMSQTDQGQSKAQSRPPSPPNLLAESQETLADTSADQETVKDLERTKESEESVGPPPHDSTDNEPESQQVGPDNTEQEVTETQVEPVESLATEEAEDQLSSDKPLNGEENTQQNSTATESPGEKDVEKDKEDKMEDEQSLEVQAETELDSDNVEVTEKSVSTSITEEPTLKEAETETTEANNGVEPAAIQNTEADLDEPTKPVDELPKELPPLCRKKDSIAQVPDISKQTEPDRTADFVNGKPVSTSGRSLRRKVERSPTLSSKTPIKPCQDVPACSVSDPAPSSTVENKKLERPPPETNGPSALETPMVQQVTEPSTEPPVSPASKELSRTKQSPKQKVALRNQRKMPVLSGQSADQAQSTAPKRQLRSASQKTDASTSGIVTSVSSPNPSTLILPPAGQLPSLLLPFPLPVTTSSVSRHPEPLMSEGSQQQEFPETVQLNTENTQPISAITEDTQKDKLLSESDPKQTLRSGKGASDNGENEKQEVSTEESNSLGNPSPVKTENQTESVTTRRKRGLRKNSALIQKNNAARLEDGLTVGDNTDPPMAEKPTRMPLRSETSKVEMPDQSVAQSQAADNKKLALRSLRSTPLSADTPKPNNVSSPVRIIPARIPRAQLKHQSGSDTPLTDNSQIPVITPKPEPPKQTVNKFFQALTGEENQHLITNLNTKYDRMLKGWVQMDKEGQPAAKYKNKSDRQAAIWKSKRRARKPKSSEQQKYSPVQMLFMKGFSLTSICRWFLESTETKSLVIVKKVNTRLPSETQLCFHSSSAMSGPSQGVFPSLQAERLKKHLKKFAIASPVKSNPKSQKLIAKALEQDANAVKLKEGAELPSSTHNLSKYSAAKASAQKGEAQKPPGKSKNPASARILRKYSNIRGKMQGQQTPVRMKGGSKMLENKKVKSLAATKAVAKSNLNRSFKAKKPAIPVSKKIKGSAAKMARRKILAGRKSTKLSVPKRAVRAQAGKASKQKSKTDVPKRCSQRLGSAKAPEHQPVDTSKSKASRKQSEGEKAECEANTKTPTKESAEGTVVENKIKEVAAETPKQELDAKASGSPDQVQTRSQRKMEAASPLCGSASNPSKRAKKAAQAASSKGTSEAEEPKLTRSGALKRSQAPSLPRSGTRVAAKRAQEVPVAPAKRTRTK